MKTKIHYLCLVNKRFYWQPRGKFKLAGFKCVSLGCDYALAAGRAIKLYAEASEFVENNQVKPKASGLASLMRRWLDECNVATATKKTRARHERWWCGELGVADKGGNLPRGIVTALQNDGGAT